MRRRDFITLMGSAAVGWPLAALAQRPAMPVVAVLSAPAAASYGRYVEAFHAGLKELGFSDGRNVAIEWHWADGHYDRLPMMAAKLVTGQVTVIATIGGTPAAFAAKAATTTIPIVFVVADDPVKLGLVDNIARPSGNVTGVSMLTGDIEAKRLELLHQIRPKAVNVAELLNPSNPQTASQIPEITKAAGTLGLNLRLLNATNETELDEAFAAAAQQHLDGLIIGADTYFLSRRDQIIGLAARYALPTVYRYRDEAASGGLLSYGTDLADAYRLEGNYVGRILKGAKPEDLPVEQSVKVDLVLNLKTAKTLGISFPLSVLGRADEVIE